MPIPDYQSIMLPLLRLAADGLEHRFRDSVEKLEAEFNLNEEEKNELPPTGSQSVFRGRVGWARTYLKQSGLLTSTKRGYFTISDSGCALLATNPLKIDLELLRTYDGFLAFKSRKRTVGSTANSYSPTASNPDETPEDALASAYRTLRSDIEHELLDQVMLASPAFFEQLVVDLLVRMGYGGNRHDAARAVGRSGDGGIDGIINEDQLGLDVIYIQAKRWENNVGRPELQKFAGALQGQRARKGLMITTAGFTSDAIEYCKTINTRIILIDGERLASLMVDFGIGVATAGTYEIKKIDSDYFDE
jgi:restriction system protein